MIVMLTNVDEIERYRSKLDQLHWLLRPGNAKKLVPGLERCGLLNNDNFVSFKNSADIFFCHVSLNSLEHEWRAFFSKSFSREMSSIEILTLVAALLVIEPNWDITVGSLQEKKNKKDEIRTLLVAYKQERDSYESCLLTFKNACDVTIQQKNTEVTTLDFTNELLAVEKLEYINYFINELPTIRARIIDEIKKYPYSIPRITRLVNCLTQVVLEPTENNLAALEKELVTHSSINRIIGMLLSSMGLMMIVSGLIVSMGTFGVGFPLIFMAVSSGFYFLNLAFGMWGVGLGLFSLTKGAAVWGDGCSVYRMKKSIEDCVRLVTLSSGRSVPITGHQSPSAPMNRDNHDDSDRLLFFQLKSRQSKDLHSRRRQGSLEIAQDFKAALLPNRKEFDFSFNKLKASTIYFEIQKEIDLIIYFKVCAAGYVDDMDGILISNLGSDLGDVDFKSQTTLEQLKNYLFDSGILLRRSELKRTLDKDVNCTKRVTLS